MIKAKKGNTHIEGTKAEVKADICVVLRTLKDDFTEDEMIEMVKLARMDEKALRKKVADKIIEDLHELFNETEENADEEKEE